MTCEGARVRDAFENRLRKRDRHLSKWAKRWPTNAFRVYDRDIPRWPFAVDRYGDHVHLQHFVPSKLSDDQIDADRADAVAAVRAALGVPVDRIHLKVRERQLGDSQYEKLTTVSSTLRVFEGEHRFIVDLDRHLDTGLFLDHREMRRMVGREVERRGPCRVLNLFAYTGAFSVWAAAAGAEVTTVDLSNTYLDRAKANFTLNGLDPARHRFERSDVLRWLPQARSRGESYDVIVLDPPTFSRSKKMERDLDVARDHEELITGAMALSRPGVALYFSNNYQGFQLADSVSDRFTVTEITHRTVPEDFAAGIHRAWKIGAR